MQVYVCFESNLKEHGAPEAVFLNKDEAIEWAETRNKTFKREGSDWTFGYIAMDLLGYQRA